MTLARIALPLLALLLAACDGGGATPGGAADTVALQYQVDGMHCDGCVQAITDKVTRLDGVTACSVSLQDRMATVSVRKASAAPAVRKAIETLGYKVKPVDGPATKAG